MKRLGRALAVIVFAPTLAWAHGGGLDSFGCHDDTKTGKYHCHQGDHKGKSFNSQAAMLAAASKKGAKKGTEKAEKAEKAEKSDKEKKAAKK